MKGIFKLIPAALAVFALASCSSDDLLQVGDKAPEQNLEQGDLIITYDPLDNAVTRGYRQGDFSMTQNRPMVYAENDVFKVYDPDMFKYEAYKYNYNGQGNAFFKSNNVTITDPKFVLFPGDKVQRGYYDSEDDCTYAEIAIPRIIKYDAASEMFIDDANTVTGYAYNLPMLGIANPLAGGKMGASKMRHMTAILKIDLENVFGNASWLRLTNQAGKVMSGTIVAKLDVSTEEARKAVKLDPSLNKSDLITYPDMYIDLRNVPSPKSVIFIPIIDGLTEADNIKLEYTAYAGDLDETPGSDWMSLKPYDPSDAGWIAASTEEKWCDTGMEFPGINFTKNNLYEGSNVFKFDNMSPNKITKLLGQYSETTQNINIALNKDLAVDDNSAKKDGYEILLPTLTNNKDITISLTENFASITQGANPATKLVIANAEGQNFTGKFTLNVADKLPASTALDIEVNVPNADIVLLGDFDKIDAKILNLIAAKSVTIGAADAAAGSTKVTDAQLKLAALGDNVKAFTIAKSATVDASTNNVTAGANTAAITINGALTGNVLGGKSTATIDVNGSVTGNVTASDDAAAVDNIITVGEGAVVGKGIIGKDANVKVTVNGEVTDEGISVGKKNTEVTISATGKVLAAGITSTSEQENVINIAGPVTGNVTSNPATITQYASKKTDVNISGIGRVSGNVALQKNLLGKLSITAVPTDNGSTDKIVTGNVTTGGFVTINLTAATDGTYKSGEGVAIGGTLTMTGATKELKLIQGYVNEIVANVNNAGSWENKFIALTLNDANEGFAAFAKLTETSGYVKYTESVWNGQYPTNADYKLTNAATPVSTEKSLYWVASDKAMFTATQLAYFADNALATNIALFNNIDMKSKEFKCLKAPTASVTFDGRIKGGITAANNHKISNLKLTNKEVVLTNDYAAPIGLFIQATNNLEVTCLDLVNVEAQTDLMPNKDGFKMSDGVTVVGVGALVGSAAATAKVTAKYVNVTLKNQNFGYTKTGADAKQFINVGGLIGYAAGGADIQNSTVTGAPISGYRYLGGLIGQATTNASDYKFTADETDVTFNLTTANTQTMDSWFGAIGGFIGTCTAKPNVTLVGSDNKAKAIDDTQNPYWGKMYVSSTSTADGRFFNLTRHQNFLGFSGRASGDTDFGFGTVTINGSAWTVPAVVPYTTTPVGNVLYHFTTEHTF